VDWYIQTESKRLITTPYVIPKTNTGTIANYVTRIVSDILHLRFNVAPQRGLNMMSDAPPPSNSSTSQQHGPLFIRVKKIPAQRGMLFEGFGFYVVDSMQLVNLDRSIKIRQFRF
jgi:hypothetical protein